jgi:hypothetical protein
MSYFSSVFEKNRLDVLSSLKQSRSWYEKQSRLLAQKNISPDRLVNSGADRTSLAVVPGEMYLFAYDAKTKDTLPYWDMFPLVFPFSKTKDSFIGLNLHYIDYPLRVKLLDRLMEFKNNANMDHTTKLRLSWSTISSASKLKIAQPCVHKYLISHLQSPLKKIDASDWVTALMLPVERFVGSSKQSVWKAK